MRGKKYLNKSQHCYTRQGRDHIYIHVNNAYQQIYHCCKPLFIFHKVSKKRSSSAMYSYSFYTKYTDGNVSTYDVGTRMRNGEVNCLIRGTCDRNQHLTSRYFYLILVWDRKDRSRWLRPGQPERARPARPALCGRRRGCLNRRRRFSNVATFEASNK